MSSIPLPPAQQEIPVPVKAQSVKKDIRLWMICFASVLLIGISVIVVSATRVDGDNPHFAGGYGTIEKPYLISTPRQLDHLRQYLGPDFAEKYYALKNDIVFTSDDIEPGGDFYNDGEGWIPIGSFSNGYTPEKAFCGNFDGNGKTIKGLFCRTHHHRSTGLFGALYRADVSNLLLKNTHIQNQCPSLHFPTNRHDRSATGAVAGRAYLSYIRRVGVQAKVEGFSASDQYRDMTGGLVGELCNSTVEDCYTEGSVLDSFYVGGIAGEAFSPGSDPQQNSQIKRCFSTAALHGGTVGGISGTTAGDAIQTRIVNCFALNKELVATDRGDSIANIYSSTVLEHNDKVETILFNEGKITGYALENPANDATSLLRARNQATWENLSFGFGNSPDKPWSWTEGKYPELKFSWLDEELAGKNNSTHKLPIYKEQEQLPDTFLISTWDGFDPVEQWKLQLIFTPTGTVTRTDSPHWNVIGYRKRNDRQYELFDAQGNYVQLLDIIDDNNIVLRWNSPHGDVKATRAHPGGTPLAKTALPEETLVSTWNGFDPVEQWKLQLIFTPTGTVTRTDSPHWNVTSYKKKNDKQYELFDAQDNYVQTLDVIDENTIVLRWNSPHGDIKATRAQPGGTIPVKATLPEETAPMDQNSSVPAQN